MNFKYQGLGTYKRTKIGRFDSFKARVRRFVRFTVRWSLISAAAYAIFMAGAFLYSTSTVSASAPQIITVEAAAPVLDRIAQCESGGNQFKNGQVLIHVNNNGTYDQGKYQINSIHNAAASKLGFNLATEEGNTGFAKWMYANLGTGDWYSSEKCWKK